jgi:hypothetical protein
MAERFAVAQDLASEREQAASALRAWVAFTHDLLLLAISPTEQVSYVDFLPAYQELTRRISSTDAQGFLHALRRAEEGLDRNANTRLALEAALLEVPGIIAVQ